MPGRSPAALANGVIVLVCAWLFITPWVLNYASDAGWNSTIVAAVIAAIALVRLLGGDRVAELRWLGWLNVVLGAWLVVAPWILSGYEDDAEKWNSVVVGVVVAALALWDTLAERPAAA